MNSYKFITIFALVLFAFVSTQDSNTTPTTNNATPVPTTADPNATPVPTSTNTTLTNTTTPTDNSTDVNNTVIIADDNSTVVNNTVIIADDNSTVINSTDVVPSVVEPTNTHVFPASYGVVANTCAKDLGRQPANAAECTSDTSMSSNNVQCCYMAQEIGSFCAAVPIGSNLVDIINSYAGNTTFNCSAGYISMSFVIMMIAALLF